MILFQKLLFTLPFCFVIRYINIKQPSEDWIFPVPLSGGGGHRHDCHFSKSSVFLFIPPLTLVAQTVKKPPAIRETWNWSLGQEDSLEKGMATHSSILASGIPQRRLSE